MTYGERNARERERRANDPGYAARRRAQVNAYAARNREKIRAQQKRYREENADSLKERWRKYHSENREKVLERKRVYYQRNKERLNAISRAYRAEYRSGLLVMQSEHKKANPDLYNEYEARRRARKKQTRVGTVDRESIIARDKQTCQLCGQHVKRTELTLDHIVPLAAGGHHVTENLQVAHRSCNSSRGVGRIPAQMRLA